MECPNCKAVVTPGNRFCSNCGHAVSPEAAAQATASPAAVELQAAPPAPAATIPQQSALQATTPSRVAPQQANLPRSKDPSTALVIELVGTLFGFMGLGWLYAGHTSPGIIALVAWLVVVIVAVVITVLTGGLFACLWLPVQVVAAIVSGLMVKQAVERDNARL